MIWCIASLILSTALILVGFLLSAAGSLEKLKENFGNTSKTTRLPIITPDGQMVDSVEDLELLIEVLEHEFEEKEKEIESAKTKQESAAQRLEKLTDTVTQMKKGFLKRKKQISKSETECTQLKSQIEDYKERKKRLREEINSNPKRYDNAVDEYEIVKNFTVTDAL
ncbi:filamin-A-interacting protein 1-like [Cylas formicarius]|uniref:filamin-A-interacting protein 1-like n=1 Tax=Cylas formicarius TaxID=197179 RepID=UPI00295853CB|nr:filamin-A-interacting protein 1-like [Cylas formicarius]